MISNFYINFYTCDCILVGSGNPMFYVYSSIGPRNFQITKNVGQQSVELLQSNSLVLAYVAQIETIDNEVNRDYSTLVLAYVVRIETYTQNSSEERLIIVHLY